MITIIIVYSLISLHFIADYTAFIDEKMRLNELNHPFFGSYFDFQNRSISYLIKQHAFKFHLSLIIIYFIWPLKLIKNLTNNLKGNEPDTRV